ncbi:hypothetical protein Ahy_B05g077799 isoform G [Arachis hypogaea]|uniref:Uncharacterized protein n=1 Tax=Arachis hypogaea TaxID=3818 RepID=A0A444Z5J8_ARAHY|nr:hypothetical protein Ahy_B05g077799 isoform G [Arachis hypogaea]
MSFNKHAFVSCQHSDQCNFFPFFFLYLFVPGFGVVGSCSIGKKREVQNSFFGKSDLSFLCILRHLSVEIKKQELEIEAAQKEELGFDHQEVAMPSVPPPNKLLSMEELRERRLTDPRLPNLNFWFRAKGKLSDDQALHSEDYSQQKEEKYADLIKSLKSSMDNLNKEANQEWGNIFPVFKEISVTDNALERVLALEIELAEALQAKKKSSMQFQRFKCPFGE